MQISGRLLLLMVDARALCSRIRPLPSNGQCDVIDYDDNRCDTIT